MKARYINEYQCMMDCMNNVDVTYVDVSHTFECGEAWRGPFYLALTKYLGGYFGTKFRDIIVLDKVWYQYLWHFVKSKVVERYALVLKRYPLIMEIRKKLSFRL